MESSTDGPVRIFLDRKGQDECGIFSFPARPRIYHQLELLGLVIHFSTAWRPIFIQGSRQWPNPLEWIKITLSGTRFYYASLGYGDLASLFSQYYVPCPVDGQEVLSSFNPLLQTGVRKTLQALDKLPELLKKSEEEGNAHLKDISKAIGRWKRFYLFELPRILKCKVNVLPPDSMICDYNLIPVIVSTGCLKNCGFCTVKDGTEFKVRSRARIKTQVEEITSALERELESYRGAFIGNLDALYAPDDLLFYAIDILRQRVPWIKNFFLFGSVHSLLEKDLSFFKNLNALGVNFFINIGIESLDSDTLALIKKPVSLRKVEGAWEKIGLLNTAFPCLDISLNILANPAFPASHWERLLLKLEKDSRSPRGTVYLSPLDAPVGRWFFDLVKSIQIRSKRHVRLYNLVGL